MAAAWATIRDVAARAGVSVGTASKAFNNKGQLAGETRRRVMAAAAELHFTPNALVRSLQRGQTLTVGVFTWPIHGAAAEDVTMTLLKGIADGTAATGRDLLLYSHAPPGRRPVTAATFLDGRVDGLILGPTTVPDADLTMLAEAGLPVVVLYRPDVPAPFGFVTVDNAAGVAAGVVHLAALGHRRIAFCGSLLTPDQCERHGAYRRALAGHGLDADPALCAAPDRWDFDAAAALRPLLGLPSPPTAVVVGDDATAFRVIEALAALGRRVPADVSVVGFDDCPAAAGAGLTTVRQPAEAVGQTAGLFASRLIGGAGPDECRSTLPVTLVARGTTAAARR